MGNESQGSTDRKKYYFEMALLNSLVLILLLNPRNPTVLCTLLNSFQENTQQPGAELISFLTNIFDHYLASSRSIPVLTSDAAPGLLLASGKYLTFSAKYSSCTFPMLH